jgi:hypothetical protein
MKKTLFRFVKQVASLAQKLTDAALMKLSHPAGKLVAGWGSAVRARDWFRQFREIALIAGVYNVEQALES